MFNGKQITVFIANDSYAYVFKKLVNKNIVDLVVTIDRDTLFNFGSTNYFDVREVYNDKIYYASKYSLKAEADRRFFSENNFDIGIVLGWSKIIPQYVIDTFNIGIIGFHDTPFELPDGRGHSSSIWTLVLGYNVSHVYAFKLTEHVDEGDILAHRKLTVNIVDDISTLHIKQSLLMENMIYEAIDNLIRENGIPQNMGLIKFRKRGEKDGKIIWHLGADRVYNLVRAITKPYPGAWTFYREEKLRIWRGVPVYEVGGEPGKVLAVIGDKFVVGCGKDSFLVTEWTGRLPYEGDVLK